MVTWLAGPRTLAEGIVPTLLEARPPAGPAPRVVAGIPVAVTDDPDQARSVANTRFARYGGLENYRRVFEQERVDSVAELAIVGTEAEVQRQLVRYAEAGVTELWAAVFPVGANEAESVDRTRAFLSHVDAGA